MRLIDADELLKQIDAERKYLIKRGQTGAEHILTHNFRDLVLNAPTIEPNKWILCSERLPRYNERVLVKRTHFGKVDTAVLCHTHLWDYWRLGYDIPEESFVSKHDMWMPIPPWKNIENKYNENQCEQCIYYHLENNTCQLKKISSLGEREGYVTSLDMKFCEFCKNKDEGEK